MPASEAIRRPDAGHSPTEAVRGRLAPSPTGYLHLGNAWSFLLAWLACRSAGGRLALRMEDLDPRRSRPAYAAAIMEDLRWLGLDWDEGPDRGGPFGPYAQSERGLLYEEALRRLKAGGHLYPCYCTRRELRDLAGAPHPAAPNEESPFGDAGAAYPGTCRHLTPEERRRREAAGRSPCLRLRCPDAPVCFVDGVYGSYEAGPMEWGGDFALRRSDGVFAYQLAVVVDDGLMGVSQVVRGADLLASTPRQLLLFDLLGFPRPCYSHVPLLCDAEGIRLAKRHASLGLRALRADGAGPEAVLGYLAWKAGLLETPRAVCARALADGILPRLGRGWTEKLGRQTRIRLEADPSAALRKLRAG